MMFSFGTMTVLAGSYTLISHSLDMDLGQSHPFPSAVVTIPT